MSQNVSNNINFPFLQVQPNELVESQYLQEEKKEINNERPSSSFTGSFPLAKSILFSIPAKQNEDLLSSLDKIYDPEVEESNTSASKVIKLFTSSRRIEQEEMPTDTTSKATDNLEEFFGDCDNMSKLLSSEQIQKEKEKAQAEKKQREIEEQRAYEEKFGKTKKGEKGRKKYEEAKKEERERGEKKEDEEKIEKKKCHCCQKYETVYYESDENHRVICRKCVLKYKRNYIQSLCGKAHGRKAVCSRIQRCSNCDHIFEDCVTFYCEACKSEQIDKNFEERKKKQNSEKKKEHTWNLCPKCFDSIQEKKIIEEEKL